MSHQLKASVSGRPGRSLYVAFAILAGSLLLVACGPVGLGPPTPTPAPELRIAALPTIGSTPTASLTRPVNAPTRLPSQPTPTGAPSVTPVPTVTLAQANESAATPIIVPTPSVGGNYPVPVVGEFVATPTLGVVGPAAEQGFPAPVSSLPLTATSTSTPVAGATVTRTATPKPGTPPTPLPDGAYPQVFNTPVPVEPPGGYPAGTR